MKYHSIKFPFGHFTIRKQNNIDTIAFVKSTNTGKCFNYNNIYMPRMPQNKCNKKYPKVHIQQLFYMKCIPFGGGEDMATACKQ